MGKFEKGKRPTQAQSYAEPQRAPKKKKQKKQSRLGLIVALLAAAVVLVGCGVGYMFLRDDGRIVNNLYVAGVDLSGMTKEEARAALEKGVSVYGKENMNVALYTRPYDTFTSTYDPAQIPLAAGLAPADLGDILAAFGQSARIDIAHTGYLAVPHLRKTLSQGIAARIHADHADPDALVGSGGPCRHHAGQDASQGYGSRPRHQFLNEVSSRSHRS